MKYGRLQCKDIPDRPILEFLARNVGQWHNWIFDEGELSEFNVRLAMPPGTPDRLVIAKMAALIRRRLVDGCACGCRGDFEITDKGLEWLQREAETNVS